MAKKKRDVKGQSPSPHGSEEKKGKAGGILFALLAFLVALTIMVAVVGGAFYIVIHNNYNGLADKFRLEIQSNPLLKWALPAPKPGYDPYDPANFKPDELEAKYSELRKLKDKLQTEISQKASEIEALKKTAGENEKYKNEINSLKSQLDSLKADIENREKALEADKKKLGEIIAKGDTAGFKAYFEKVDNDTAQKVYKEIIEEQKISEDAAEFAKIYEKMDAGSIAKILESLGEDDMDLIVDILSLLKQQQVTNILSNMKSDFAAEVTRELSVKMLPAKG